MCLRHLTLVVAICLAWSSLFADNGPSGEPLDALYEQVMAAKGQEYITLRDNLLGMDHDEVKVFLENKRTTIAEPIESLLVDALLAHLDHSDALQRALNEAFAEAAKNIRPAMRNPYGPPTPPRPTTAAFLFWNQFKRKAVARACEMLVKDLMVDWDQWKKMVPVWVLRLAGQERTYLPLDLARSRHQEVILGDIQDLRAGYALLWVVENRNDDIEEFARKRGFYRKTLSEFAAKDCFIDFPDETLVAAARAARSKSTTPDKRARLESAVEMLESALQGKELWQQMVATQPAPTSRPASAPAPMIEPEF